MLTHHELNNAINVSYQHKDRSRVEHVQKRLPGNIACGSRLCHMRAEPLVENDATDQEADKQQYLEYQPANDDIVAYRCESGMIRQPRAT